MGTIEALVGVHRAAINIIRAISAAISILNCILTLPILQAVVGNKDVKTRERLVLSVGLTRHRELMLTLDYRSAVVKNGIELATHHLGIEVGNLRILRTIGGAELLKHALEGHILTSDNGIGRRLVLTVGHVAVLLAGLALAQDEEAVVITRDVENGTSHLTLTHAQTIGQQLHRSHIVANVVNQLVGRGEEVRLEGIIFVFIRKKQMFYNIYQLLGV